VSDLDLTPTQWKMARQAGASFTDESDLEPVGEFGEQLTLAELGPHGGDLYRNVHTGLVGCVVRTATRRRTWVTIRHSGRLTDVSLDQLAKHWRACRPDGSLL
jgi:hypothetical protein